MGNTASGSSIRGGGGSGGGRTKKLDRIELHEAVVPFDNLTSDCIARLWDRFVAEAASFAVSEADLLDMCERSLRHVIKTDAKPFDDVVKDLFHLFAGSEPGVQHVDFMEVQMALLFCATHSFEAKANFIFDCMDFEGTDWVTQPAFEITFKSIEAGLRKISVDPNVDPGKLTKERTGQNAELNIQNMASSWFDQCRNMRDDRDMGEGLTRRQFIDFCESPDHNILQYFKLFADADGADLGSDLEAEGSAMGKHQRNATTDADGTFLIENHDAAGTGFSTTASIFARPWLQELVSQQSAIEKEVVITRPPSSRLRLDWVHGCRLGDCRNNVLYTADADAIVYHAAGVAVVLHFRGDGYDADDGAEDGGDRAGRQQFCLEHADDILSMATANVVASGTALNAPALSVAEEEEVEGQEEGKGIEAATGEAAKANAKEYTLVATGEVGTSPRIIVWSPEARGKHEPIVSLCSIEGSHERGVSHLTFSRPQLEGNQMALRLVSVGLDDHHRISVHELVWDSPTIRLDSSPQVRLRCSAASGSERVFGLIDNPFDFDRFVTCGAKHLNFWRVTPYGLEKDSILRRVQETLISGVFLSHDVAVFGCATGGLKVYLRGAETKARPGHYTWSRAGEIAGNSENAINTLFVCERTSDDAPHVVLAGSKDGRVCAWKLESKEPEPGQTIKYVASEQRTHAWVFNGPLWTIDLNDGSAQGAMAVSMLPTSPQGELKNLQTTAIRSICLDTKHGGDTARLLVGTRGCEVFEFEMTNIENQGGGPVSVPRLLVQGHCMGELWGLAVHPKIHEYCTVGDDWTLRIWDSGTHRQKYRSMALPGPARACTYSPDGMTLVVGFGGQTNTSGRGKSQNGLCHVYSLVDVGKGTFELPSICQLRDARQDVSEVKFSPDGKVLAVASNDNSVYLYSVSDTFSLLTKFNKHNSRITHIDFSTDSRYLQTNCGSYERLACQTSNGRQIQCQSEELESIEWETQTCVVDAAVRGVWTACPNSTNVTGIDRLKGHDVDEAPVLAVSDDHGSVRLFRYPCTEANGHHYHEYIGHSACISTIRWGCGQNDDYLAKKAKIQAEAEGEGEAVEYDSDEEETILQYLYTTGARDRCIFQWVHEGEAMPDDLDLEEPGSPTEEGEFGKAHREASDKGEDSLLVGSIGLDSGGDEFMAVKPWLGAIKEPTELPKANRDEALKALYGEQKKFADQHKNLSVEIHSGVKGSGGAYRVGRKEGDGPDLNLPAISESLQATRFGVNKTLVHRSKSSKAPDNDGLELEWIHGYQGQENHDNVRYVKRDPKDDVGKGIGYHAAAVGIVLHRADNADDGRLLQSFQTDHTDDIVSFAVHPNLNIVATGQLGKNPAIEIWSTSPSIERRQTLQGFHKRAVTNLCFSTEGDLLASIGNDDAHSMAIYSWASGALVGTAKGDGNKVLAMQFEPRSPNLVSAGIKHVRFWNVQGRSVSSKRGILGSKKVGWNLGFEHCSKKLQKSSQLKSGKPKTKEKGKLQPFTCIGWRTVVTKGKAAKKKGKKGKKKKAKAIKSSEAVVGAASGELYVFDDKRNLKEIINAHAKAVMAVYSIADSATKASGPACLVTGGKDSKVRIWTSTWEMLHDFTAPGSAPISSVCLRGDALKLLVGTQRSEIYEVDVPGSLSQSEGMLVKGKYEDGKASCEIGNALVKGHYQHELWGLAVHTRKRVYCTVGDDCTLRLWDVAIRKECAELVALPCMARACAIHEYPDEDNHGGAEETKSRGHWSDGGDRLHIAVGMGGSVGQGRQKLDGCVRVYSYTKEGDIYKPVARDGEVAYVQIHDAHEWISDIKFSPDGKTLAVGSHDNAIYLYGVDVEDDGEGAIKIKSPPRTFKKHSSYITHFDFDCKSMYLQSNCGAYELLFSDVSTGRQITSASSLRDEEWATWTCTLGWPVQGIWPPCADGTDVNAVARSGANTLIATADDFGKVKLFRYPAVQKGAGSLEYRGHSSHVTNIRWTALDECLISTGGNDRCVFQWRHEAFERDPMVSLASSAAGGARPAGGEDDESDAEALDMLDEDDGPAKDAFMTVKPWVGQITAPSLAPTLDPRAPDHALSLEWVYGYRSQDTRHNLYYTCHDNSIVYHAASMGVILKGLHDSGSSSSEEEKYEEGDDVLIKCMEAEAGTGKLIIGAEAPAFEAVEGGAELEAHETACFWLPGTLKKRHVEQVPVSKNKEAEQPEQKLDTWTVELKAYRASKDTQLSDKATKPIRASCIRRPTSYKQVFHSGHDDDITCLAISHDRQFVATGQVGKNPTVRIWHAVSGALLTMLPVVHQRGIAALGFSQSGEDGPRCLASVGLDELHTHAVWRDDGGHWSKVSMIASGRGGRDKVSFVHWLVDGSEFKFVSGGDDHIDFWTISGGICRSKKGLFGGEKKPTTITGAVNHFMGPSDHEEGVKTPGFRLITACATGSLFRWEGRNFRDETPFTKQGEFPVSAIAAIGDTLPTSRLVAGNTNGTVKVFDKSMKLVAEYKLENLSDSLFDTQAGDWRRHIRSIDMMDQRILIGTKGSEIFEIRAPTHSPSDGVSTDEKILNLHHGPLVQGHYKHELWGLAFPPPPLPSADKSVKDPFKDLFATTGDDGTLRIWNMCTNSVVAEANLTLGGVHQMSRAVAWTRAEGAGVSVLAVGLGGDAGRRSKGGGGIKIFTFDHSYNLLCTEEGEAHKLTGWVSDLKFYDTPVDGGMFRLAAASHDNTIVIYDIDPDQFEIVSSPDKKNVITKHDAAVMHIDFSDDGHFLQSSDAAQNLTYHNLGGENFEHAMKKISSRETADFEWASWTSPLGWPVYGIWSDGPAEVDINACHRSPSGRFLAIGDAAGRLSLYNNPCPKKGAQGVCGTGHSGHVMNVRFASDTDEVLVTCGGNDRCIMRWGFSSQ